MDAGISLAVSSVEVEALGRSRRSTLCDLELDTGRVELGAADRVLAIEGVAFMQTDDLGAEQILSSSQGGGESDGSHAAGGDQVVNGPDVGAAVIALRGDLGPDGVGAIRIGVFSNVSLNGALVRAGDDVVTAAMCISVT